MALRETSYVVEARPRDVQLLDAIADRTPQSDVVEVFALNILLAALAVGSIMAASAALKIVLLLAGSIATALLMYRFSQRRAS